MGKLLAMVKRVWIAAVGRVAWDAPPWSRWLWARKLKSLAALAVIGALATGGYYGWRWWDSRPKPEQTHVTLSAPEVTRWEDGRPQINPLRVEFDHSAALLDKVGKNITAGVELSPKIEGHWNWDSDHELTFTPAGDWPIGQEYTVKLASKGLVAAHILLDTHKLEFKTAPFTVRMAESQFYQDPVDANLKKVVVTLTFSHPVDTATLEKRVSMRFVPSNKEEKEADYKVHISYDRWKLNAYLHSEPVNVPQKDAVMVVTLAAGVSAQRGGPVFDEKLEEKVKVPGLYNFLKVESSHLAVVDNEKNEPEQVLVVETSAGVSESEMQKSVQAWVLPLYDPSDADEAKKKRPHEWNDANVIGAELLKKGNALKLTAIASEKEYSTLHSFKFRAEVGRWVYVEVKKGLHAFGGYVLGDSYTSSEKVEPFPRQLRLMHSGAILSMAGEKKVSVFARDVPAIRFEIGRVLPDQLHHLFTQSSGVYQHPSFNYNFGEENLAEMFTEVRPLSVDPGKPQYEALDLSKYLGARGVFLLKVESWDAENNRALGESDERLIVVSDLGLVVKDNADQTHDVFVQSIHSGDPVGGVRIQVMGKNGQPVISATTDGDGHATFGNLTDFKRERQPVAWVAQKERDTSFLPMQRSDRSLDTSRFDVGGVSDTGASPQSLQAYVFSDRGLYRPGDEMRFGILVRSRDWKQPLAGIPLQAVLIDARGLTVRKENIKLSAAGFEELRHSTPDVAPTGTYTLNIHVIKDGRPANLLGSTTVRVREFLPDRMKIAAHLSTENPRGWVKPSELKANVALANLFGTAAAGHKIKAEMVLTPSAPSLDQWRGFLFSDPMEGKQSFHDSFADVETDDQGNAEFDLALQRFAAATYRLSFTAEGFEAEGGRSVAGEVSAMVSPLEFLVGYKPDGDLTYLTKGSSHQVELMAVGPTGDRTEAKDLEQVLIERKFVSVLMRKDNGTYRYESVLREEERSHKALAIPAAGTKLALSTTKPGDYAMDVRDKSGRKLTRVLFSVAGTANLDRSMDKNAELQMQLKKKDVEPGEEIELSIKAPFTGAGLITIEREKVFSHRWFKSTTTASVQHIKLPEDFEGGGYVSVAFVRDAGSDDVFMSPLSYGIQPFSVNRSRRVAEVKLEAPELVKPGEPYKMKVTSDRPTKLVVFAVDEGILRVAHYDAPDPLGFFFRKRALGVRTSQILDLILPEYSKLMAALAPGGDDEAALNAHLNPFKRKQNKPVAYWSGIVDAGPKPRELVYQVPDYFNGTLKVFAVAVAADSVGTFDGKTLVRGDFVLSPNVPLVAAPGDEIEVSVGVANNVAGSGKGAAVDVGVQVGKGLELVGAATQKVSIDEMREGAAKFRIRATRDLGSAAVSFTAATAGKSGHITTDMSVRPASPYLVTFQAGHLKSGQKTVPVERQLYVENRKLEAGLSHLPLGLTHGLAGYLKEYPNGCTEQLVSQAVPAIVLGKRPEFGYSPEIAAKSVASAVSMLRSRQNEEGAFGLWAANPRVDPLASVYAVHVLTEARERGWSVPSDTLKNGLAWLQSVAHHDGDSLPEERVRAYAIYVLTRNGMVTSGFAQALQKHLEANYPKEWRKDLAAAYLAATYQLLRQDKLGRSLMEEQAIGQARIADYRYYDDSLAHDAQLLYLWARHFPERAAKVSPVELDAMVQPIFQGLYNTFSSAQTILALEAYGEAAHNGETGDQTIKEILGKESKQLALPANMLPLAAFDAKASAVEFSTAGAFGSYWLVEQRGFDTELPKKPITQKVEVFREYRDAKGKVVDHVTLGDEVEVHVKMRSLKGELSQLAILDLLPGGFEVVVQPPPAHEDNDRAYNDDTPPKNDNEGEGEDVRGAGDEDEGHVPPEEESGRSFALPIALGSTTFTADYGDVREDRVVLYGDVGTDVREFVYSMKATNVGKYTVPPVQAEAMYDRSVVARGVAGTIEVVPR
jgi:alpha-2-macroglobulin